MLRLRRLDLKRSLRFNNNLFNMPKKKLNFVESFKELEDITEWFDSEENLDLDKGLKKFERGLELAGELKKKLSEIENRVEEIKEKFAE
jgi:exodeoxyribonuclease VII small subunit